MKEGIRCKNCGDELFSYHRHDYKRCSCRNTAIDGGDDYTRIIGYSENIETIYKQREQE